jgi:polyphosphate glucokinase
MILRLAERRPPVDSSAPLYLGFDVGGSGIKWGCLWQDPARSEISERAANSPWHYAPGQVIALDAKAHPQDVLELILSSSKNFRALSGLGLALPGVVKNHVLCTAANINKEWLGFQLADHLARELGLKHAVQIMNDADAAGLAELNFGGSPKLGSGVTLMLTLGTGIGSALFIDGKLVPNTELGHLQLSVKQLGSLPLDTLPSSPSPSVVTQSYLEAEHWASARVRTLEGLSWQQWGTRVGQVLQEYSRLLWPDQMVLGGAVSENFDDFIPYVRSQLLAPVALHPARLGNDAGWLGSALAIAGHFC